MWAAQAFLLYGGEPTFSNQMQMIGSLQSPRAYLNTQIGLDQRNSPQMFISTPMPNTANSGFINRALQNAPMQSPLQHSQYPLSPSKRSHFNIYF